MLQKPQTPNFRKSGVLIASKHHIIILRKLQKIIRSMLLLQWVPNIWCHLYTIHYPHDRAVGSRDLEADSILS